MICLLPDTRTTTTTKGAAAAPLMTATKISSLIGLICSRLRAVPPRVPRATRAQKTGGFADGPLEAPFLAQEPGHAAEPAPASTGMGSRPLPMNPSAKIALAKWPAKGLECLDGLGCAWMLVLPWLCPSGL